MKKQITTLCIIHQGDKVLLAMKKRGFGKGRWNGFGGKVKEGETLENSIKREITEEGGITVSEMERVGAIDFEFKETGQVIEVNIFKAEKFEGTPSESEEMKPQWFDIDKIPYKEMWPDDRYWLPLLLAGKKFKGKFLFGPNDSILDHDLDTVKNPC